MADKPLKAPLGATQKQGGEQEARELLAAEYEREGLVDIARSIRIDEVAALTLFQQCAIRAITAALRAKQPAANSSSNELEGNNK